MIPIDVEKPSSRARRLMARASSGFRVPPPSTELMLTSNSACRLSHSSFPSSSRRLFFDTASGSTLSMLICRKSRPASFSAAIFFGESR